MRRTPAAAAVLAALLAVPALAQPPARNRVPEPHPVPVPMQRTDATPESGALPPPAAVAFAGARGTSPLRLAADRPVVEARVNGARDLVLGVETGSAYAALTRAAIDSLGLPKAGEDATGTYWRVDSLRFGDVVVRGLLVRDIAPSDRTIDGILGLGVFANVLLTIDYPAARLTLERGALPSPDGKTVLPTHLVGPFHAVDLSVAGRTMRCVIDTRGSSAFGFTPAAGDSLPFVAPPVVVGRAGGAAIPMTEVKLGRLAGDVTLGAHRFERPLLNIRALPPGFPDGLIGSAALKSFALTLDQTNHRVRFARDTATPVPAPPPMRDLGVRLRARPGELPEIADVRPGTPADSLGIQPGDVVLTIAGTDAAHLDPARFRALADSGAPVPLTLKRGDKTWDVNVRPAFLVP